MKFLIVTGMSGAGKSRAAAVLEDIDFYCVDNMPAALMPKFAELCLATRGRYERVALVSDIRGGDSFDELLKALDHIKEMGCESEMLFMDAEDEVLINRYKETRRRHPLSTDGASLSEAVKRERELLRPLRERADYVIDTSELHTSRLQRELYTPRHGRRLLRRLPHALPEAGRQEGLQPLVDISPEGPGTARLPHLPFRQDAGASARPRA